MPQTEGQIRALAQSLLREKGITRLVELTTDPEIAETETSEEESSVEPQAESNEAVVLASEEEAVDTQKIEEHNSQSSLSNRETVEVENTSADETAHASLETE
jgi:hypothetical protein